MAKTQMNLTQGPIFRKIFLFSLPILAGAIITEMYNVVDSMIVGQFIGSNALAAVSACSPSTNIINLFLIGFQTGASVVVAQKVGAQDKKHLQDAVSTIAVLTLLAGLILVAAGLLIADPMLKVLKTPEVIFNDASWYLKIIFIGSVGNLIYNVGSGMLRGMGDSTWPFIFLTLCAFLNLILDLIAVEVLHLGVAGVAAATAISQMVSGLGIVVRLNHSDYGATLHPREFRVVKEEARLLASVALPSGIQNIGNTLAALFMQSYVNHFGPAFAAANNIVNKVENFSYIPIVAISSAVCTYVGQNIGCGQMKRIHQGINQSIAFLTSLGLLLCIVMKIFRNVIPMLFTTDAAVVEFAAVGLNIICYVSIFNGIDRVLLNAMRAAGRSVVPMITAQFGCFSRILFGYLLAMRTDHYQGIFQALLLASFARMFAIAFYYYCGSGKRAIDQFPYRKTA